MADIQPKGDGGGKGEKKRAKKSYYQDRHDADGGFRFPASNLLHLNYYLL